MRDIETATFEYKGGCFYVAHGTLMIARLNRSLSFDAMPAHRNLGAHAKTVFDDITRLFFSKSKFVFLRISRWRLPTVRAKIGLCGCPVNRSPGPRDADCAFFDTETGFPETRQFSGRNHQDESLFQRASFSKEPLLSSRMR